MRISVSVNVSAVKRVACSDRRNSLAWRFNESRLVSHCDRAERSVLMRSPAGTGPRAFVRVSSQSKSIAWKVFCIVCRTPTLPRISSPSNIRGVLGWVSDRAVSTRLPRVPESSTSAVSCDSVASHHRSLPQTIQTSRSRSVTRSFSTLPAIGASCSGRISAERIPALIACSDATTNPASIRRGIML